jgi:polyribonucleotide nucleotidyltransferase
MSKQVTAQIGDKSIVIETGKYARQAHGSVTVHLGDTIILVAATAASKARPGQDFFPLTVDYREKASAVGRFPGGYFKREGRPTEKEILTCRLTDRPIRPLFPKGWLNETQVQTLLLSADGENDSDILSILGASAALSVSDIPWDGPLGAVRVGRVGEKFIMNPTHTEMEESDLDLIYVGNEDDVVMFEGTANEISEADFDAALRAAQEACKPLIAAQKELVALAGKTKRVFEPTLPPDNLVAAAKEMAGDRLKETIVIPGKADRENAVAALKDEVSAALVEKFGEEIATDEILKDTFYAVQKHAARDLMVNDKRRMDGRGFDDIRPITSEVGFLPRVHGSAVFTRGETQAMALATLGTKDDVQGFDAYTGGVTEKQFLLHYNFPNYSVGETGRIMGPGRREIGHGALAERSVLPMLPLDDFPYAVRITSEIMESNGSSSMASVCGATLALMDAGVPMTRPVAGISIGICTTQDANGKLDKYEFLTDILGWEDGFGDMDCKIAGTSEGITGFQLDLKLRGISHDIMTETLVKAKDARIKILASMAETIAEPREELSPLAPRITTLKVNPEKIGAIIGPGGRNIKKIVEESGCEINIEDDGSILIYSVAKEGMEIAKAAITQMTAEIEVGKIYRGKVVSIKDFGCFVEVFPGKDGLCHISELANFRVKNTEDIVKMGDEVWVKCLGIDDKGRVKLSRKAAMEERDRMMQEEEGGGEGETETKVEVEGADVDTKEVEAESEE